VHHYAAAVVLDGYDLARRNELDEIGAAASVVDFIEQVGTVYDAVW
jgi:hypothetical protein